MAKGRYANQYFTTVLSVIGGIDSSQTTDIVIQSTTGIQDTSKPGVALLSYADPLNEDTAEWILYDSINSTTKTFVGVTRGAEKGSAKSHSNGVTVAFPLSESHINPLVDAVSIGGSATNIITGVLDEDTMSSDSAVKVPTQQSVKAYIDTPTKTIELPASAWSPTTTSGCATVTTVEAATNDIDYKVLDFDASSDENAFCNFQMPDSYDGGTVQFRYVWTNASGLTTETVVFELSGRSFANDEAIDQAVGTPVEVSDTWIAQGDIHVSAWSSAVTLAGTPAGGEWVHLEIMRDVSEDNLTGDARLIGVQVKYSLSTHSD